MLSLRKAVACEDADLGSLPHDNEYAGHDWGRRAPPKPGASHAWELRAEVASGM
jgi:hypothetical protein